jgi:uncharacterized membrane protein
MLTLLLQAAATPEGTSVADTVRRGVEWIRLLAEVAGAVIIALGIVVALVGVVRALTLRHAAAFTHVRLSLGRYLALGLEFQLASDILSTAVAPSWDQIGKLGAIAVIRTVLNFFLTRELREAGHIESGIEPGDDAEATRRENTGVGA